MTMPHERTRSLRMMGEFLLELKTGNSLPPQAILQIDTILEHFPVPALIQEWALRDSADPDAILGPKLAPEVNLPPAQGASLSLVCSDTSSAEQRLNALKDAYDFVHHTLSELECLTEEQNRTRSAVLRHYPDHGTLRFVSPQRSTQMQTSV